MAKVIICVTVDWEGEHLGCVDDLLAMRKRFPVTIPVTHFICPAYFVNPSNETKGRVMRGIAAIDEVGMHIHPFRELIEAIGGIPFRTQPNFHERMPLLELLPDSMFKSLKRFLVSGRGVPLSTYTSSEIHTILNYSLHLLREAFPSHSVASFRCGGWLATDHVLGSVERLGLTYDSSAVPPDIVSRGYSRTSRGNYRDDYDDSNKLFAELVCQVWGYHLNYSHITSNHLTHAALNGNAVNKHTQPFRIGGITEIPNNGGLSDFASVDRTLTPLLNYALKQAEAGSDFYLTIGCHQEGDWYYKGELARFIASITANQLERIEFATIRNAGERAKETAE